LQKTNPWPIVPVTAVTLALEVSMLLLTLDPTSAPPLYEQIYRGIIRLVDDGTLLPGFHLPATRRLAATLGVNRTTVFRAYQELWARGYLESRPGSYSTVRRPGQLPARGTVPQPAQVRWNELAPPRNRELVGALKDLPSRPGKGDGLIDFSSLMADRDLCPADDLRRAVKHVLVSQGKDLLGYGDPQGYRPLREAIAQRLRTHGVTASADEILVTGGSQQALDLVLRTFTRPGDRVAVEAPTYSMAHPLLRLHDVEVAEVPMRPDGLDLDVLTAVCAERRPVLVYTIPTFHNPTGTTTSQTHREHLLALCRQHRIPLVEDGFDEELKYFGKAVLPIKSMDREGLVIYLGTFSKVVFSGLRVGWVAAPAACVQHLLAIYRFSNLSGNTLGQAAMARFIDEGLYEVHLRRLHRAYRGRMQAMLKGMAAHMPPGVEWTRPAGGYTLWVQIPPAAGTEAELEARLRHHGVAVVAGNHFFCSPQPMPAFRLSIANLKEPQIAEGCLRLGRALAEAMEGRHAA